MLGKMKFDDEAYTQYVHATKIAQREENAEKVSERRVLNRRITLLEEERDELYDKAL